MYFSLVLIAAVAFVGVSEGQFTPTSQCGIQGKQCYDSLKDRVRKKLEETDYAGACKANRNLLSCLNGIPDSDTCTDIQNYKTLLLNTTTGICDPNNPGSLTECADQLGGCVNQIYTIKSDFQNNQATKACPLIKMFETCSSGILTQKVCPKQITDTLTKLQNAMSEEDMTSGCDGPCAQLIGNCTLKLVYDITNMPVYRMNWTDFCIQGYGSRACVEKIPTNSGPCARAGSTTSVVDDMMHSYTAYLKDYCDANGQPSKCMIDLDECRDELVQMSSTANVTTQCQIAANFLECSSKLPCENQLKTTVDSMRKNFETSETQQHCPTVGSCSERIENCNSVSTQLGQVNKNTQKDQFCKIVNGAVSCFDFVRKDPICINEQMVVSDFETMLAVEMAPACGASIGTCIDRIKVCSMNQKIVSAVDNTTQKDEFCKRVVTGVSCFDGIRSDVNCKIDKPELTSWESQLRNIITPYCKNAGEPIKFLPYMLLAPLCIIISRWLRL
ncbi:hypothetical protein Btru_071318 [Bulinus truncatus]|nr:hypothetical protein Btru_071318 [Bulinus truncatus]